MGKATQARFVNHFSYVADVVQAAYSAMDELLSVIPPDLQMGERERTLTSQTIHRLWRTTLRSSTLIGSSITGAIGSSITGATDDAPIPFCVEMTCACTMIGS